MKDPAEPILAGIPLPHEGEHELFTPDPIEQDGTCAHDYLCAYCNTTLDGEVVKRIKAGINLSLDDVELLIEAAINGKFENERRGHAFKEVLVRLNTFLTEAGKS